MVAPVPPPPIRSFSRPAITSPATPSGPSAGGTGCTASTVSPGTARASFSGSVNASHIVRCRTGTSISNAIAYPPPCRESFTRSSRVRFTRSCDRMPAGTLPALGHPAAYLGHQIARHDLGHRGQRLVLHARHTDGHTPAQVLQRALDDLVGLQPHPARDVGGVDVGALVELGVGEAGADREHAHAGAVHLGGDRLAEVGDPRLRGAVGAARDESGDRGA